MSNGIDVSVVVPAYNERDAIGTTITEIVEYFDRRGERVQVVVAADGNDGTREHVRETFGHLPDLQVLGSAGRGGKGLGIRRAVPHCRGRVIGFVDADNKTPIDEYDKFAPLLAAGTDLVIGARRGPGCVIERKQKLYRRVGSWGFRQLLRAVVPLPRGVVDTQCGFKFFQADVARDLFARQRIDGYMFDVEILHLACLSNHVVETVPVRWRDDGDSRLDVVSGNLRNLRDVFGIRFRRTSATTEPTTVPTAAAETTDDVDEFRNAA